MQIVGTVFQGLYLFGGLASLAAITAILHHLRYPRAAVLAPSVSTIALVLVFQMWAFIAVRIPLFAYGVYATFMPALSLVIPICIVSIALSKRLRSLGSIGPNSN